MQWYILTKKNWHMQSVHVCMVHEFNPSHNSNSIHGDATDFCGYLIWCMKFLLLLAGIRWAHSKIPVAHFRGQCQRWGSDTTCMCSTSRSRWRLSRIAGGRGRCQPQKWEQQADSSARSSGDEAEGCHRGAAGLVCWCAADRQCRHNSALCRHRGELCWGRAPVDWCWLWCQRW